uniref:Lipocalin/cytosolic fatty-acid binding domain-containing protein n=1 Tax=Salarias fasciatus TaxID=181472 RepID=A0A672GCE4_SALFA
MLAVYLTTLLCCLAVSHSAPTCEDLLQPLDQVDFQHFQGSWPLIAGAFSNQTDVDFFNSRESTTISFGEPNNSSEILFTLAFNINGSCQSVSDNATVEGGSFVLGRMNKRGTFYNTSSDDSILIDFDNASETNRRLYLFSKKREVENEGLQLLSAQAACLKLELPLQRDPTKASSRKSTEENHMLIPHTSFMTKVVH